MFDTEWESAGGLLEERGVLPVGMEEMAPGPQLGAALAGIDRADLNGHELVVLLRARARQVAHLQAELYADMRELAHTPGGYAGSPPERLDAADEFAADEVAAALTMSSRSADLQLAFACDLSRLAGVWQALWEGKIDLYRARVFCRETSHLDQHEANQVADSLLHKAPALTAAQLARRLRRRCLEADPEAARIRYEQGVAARRVEAYSNPDGTADLCARHLPAERAAALLSRIDTLAAGLKGHDGRSIDQLRADVVVDLLEGKPHPMGHRTGHVDITVDLPTLLGLADRAGDLAGWGPVVSDLARRVVAEQDNARWEVMVSHPDSGEPVWTGVTRRRPTAAQARHVRARNPVCVFPGCSARVRRSHLDHTVDHHLGGSTTTPNLGPLCPRHHLRTKHRAGWRLQQPQPGTFQWISPRNHHYTVRPPPP